MSYSNHHIIENGEALQKLQIIRDKRNNINFKTNVDNQSVQNYSIMDMLQFRHSSGTIKSSNNKHVSQSISQKSQKISPRDSFQLYPNTNTTSQNEKKVQTNNINVFSNKNINQNGNSGSAIIQQLKNRFNAIILNKINQQSIQYSKYNSSSLGTNTQELQNKQKLFLNQKLHQFLNSPQKEQKQRSSNFIPIPTTAVTATNIDKLQKKQEILYNNHQSRNTTSLDSCKKQCNLTHQRTYSEGNIFRPFSKQTLEVKQKSRNSSDKSLKIKAKKSQQSCIQETMSSSSYQQKTITTTATEMLHTSKNNCNINNSHCGPPRLSNNNKSISTSCFRTETNKSREEQSATSAKTKVTQEKEQFLKEQINQFIIQQDKANSKQNLILQIPGEQKNNENLMINTSINSYNNSRKKPNSCTNIFQSNSSYCNSPQKYDMSINNELKSSTFNCASASCSNIEKKKSQYFNDESVHSCNRNNIQAQQNLQNQKMQTNNKIVYLTRSPSRDYSSFSSAVANNNQAIHHHFKSESTPINVQKPQNYQQSYYIVDSHKATNCIKNKNQKKSNSYNSISSIDNFKSMSKKCSKALSNVTDEGNKQQKTTLPKKIENITQCDKQKFFQNMFQKFMVNGLKNNISSSISNTMSPNCSQLFMNNIHKNCKNHPMYQYRTQSMSNIQNIFQGQKLVEKANNNTNNNNKQNQVIQHLSMNNSNTNLKINDSVEQLFQIKQINLQDNNSKVNTSLMESTQCLKDPKLNKPNESEKIDCAINQQVGIIIDQKQQRQWSGVQNSKQNSYQKDCKQYITNNGNSNIGKHNNGIHKNNQKTYSPKKLNDSIDIKKKNQKKLRQCKPSRSQNQKTLVQEQNSFQDQCKVLYQRISGILQKHKQQQEKWSKEKRDLKIKIIELNSTISSLMQAEQ